jgi:hypothetical protein
MLLDKLQIGSDNPLGPVYAIFRYRRQGVPLILPKSQFLILFRQLEMLDHLNVKNPTTTH